MLGFDIYSANLILCCSFVVSTISASDFEVKTIEVNSDVKFACVFVNTSLLTMLKYGQNSATEMSLLAYKYKIDKQFTVANESYTGRIAVHNSSRVVLAKVTVKDNGFYNCRIEHSSGKFEEDKVQLKIGGIVCKCFCRRNQVV